MDAKKLQKLRELSEVITQADQKRIDLLSELSMIEKIKLDAEIEIEDVLSGSWSEEELMGCVV